MIKTLQILIILFSGQILCYSQDVLSFEEENITFKIQDSVFIVQGLYYFNSKYEKQYSILYPFPSDSIYGKPFNVNVIYINTGETISYKVNKDSSSIIFHTLISGKTPIMISYHQQLKSNKAKYILISTNYWNKPLGQVDYKLITELDFKIKSFSIPPDKEISLDNKKIYLWQKENFKPTIDFEIEY
jgi:hypothetical protein